MIEQDPVHGEHPVTLPVIFRDPETVLLGHPVRGTGVKRGRFFLGNFLHQPEQFRGGRLVNPALLFHAQDTNGFQQAKRSHRVGLRRVLGAIERHFHVTLCRQVIDFRRPHLLQNSHQRARVRHVPVMEVYQLLVLHVPYPLVQVKMLDASRVKRRGTTDDPVYLVPLFQ